MRGSWIFIQTINQIIMNLQSLKIIGMIHFPPLLGFSEYPGIKYIIEKTEKDLKALEEWGVNAIIIENNYDIPHTRNLAPEIIAEMTRLALFCRERTNLPIGICCLWNDWRSALTIAKVANLDFVRIPVFVDHIKTNYGYEIRENPEEILKYCTRIQAEWIKILADIHVKHSTILNSDTIEESAIQAVEKWVDGIIITGKWTGDMPDMTELRSVRAHVWGKIPIFTGSGATDANIKTLLSVADGAIIGTFFKTENTEKHTINIRSFEEIIDREKVYSITQQVW